MGCDANHVSTLTVFGSGVWDNGIIPKWLRLSERSSSGSMIPPIRCASFTWVWVWNLSSLWIFYYVGRRRAMETRILIHTWGAAFRSTLQHNFIWTAEAPWKHHAFKRCSGMMRSDVIFPFGVRPPNSTRHWWVDQGQFRRGREFTWKTLPWPAGLHFPH
jgi:hypothetical protein